LNLSTVVPASIFLSIADSGGSFDQSDTSETLDFDGLEDGEYKSFDIRVKGNTGYNISMTSDNESTLANTGSTQSTVPYTIKVGGSTKDLSGGSSVVVGGSYFLMASTGDAYPVQVTIGTVGDADPGTYTDIISVEISAE
jgi:hypothetical protein